MKEEILKQRILTADEGMYLTNGDTFGKVITLPMGADASLWYEITEEEKLRIENEQNEKLKAE